MNIKYGILPTKWQDRPYAIVRWEGVKTVEIATGGPYCELADLVAAANRWHEYQEYRSKPIAFSEIEQYFRWRTNND